MKSNRLVALVATFAIALASGITVAGASGKEKLEATEIGVTEDEIRIAVIADSENSFAPGIFQAAADGVEAFAKYVNKTQGGLAGRKLVVDFYDSKISPDETRNAIAKACEENFAVVGTTSVFVNNVDDLIACPDKSGAATGVPDFPTFVTEVVHQCSPVSFPVNPPQLDCATKDQHPQTYRANAGPVHRYQRTHGKDLHGIFTYTNDIKSAQVGGLAAARGAQAAGVERDEEFGLSATSTQPAYTPLAQRMKEADSNYALNSGPVSMGVALRKEAKLQGVPLDDIVWDCNSNCYDEQFIEQGGADAEGQYATITHIPFNETKHNKALANYVKFARGEKVDGYGAYAWVASILFRDLVNQIVKESGPNALTRRALLDAAEKVRGFDADGMWATTDIGTKTPSPCFISMQVKNGEWTRVYPKKPGTFDCKKSNRIETQEELLGS